MFLGITCCKISKENGYSFEDSIQIFDELCLGMRKLVRNMYLITDAFPNGFQTVMNSIVKDLTTDKKYCWDFEIISKTEDHFAYKIHKCLYLDACEKYGIRDFYQVFCNHDIWAYGSLHKHTKFIRYSTLVDSEYCHDEFIKI